MSMVNKIGILVIIETILLVCLIITNLSISANANREIKLQTKSQKFKSSSSLSNHVDPILSDYLDGDPVISEENHHAQNGNNNLDNEQNQNQHITGSSGNLGSDSSDYNYFKDNNPSEDSMDHSSAKSNTNNNNNDQNNHDEIINRQISNNDDNNQQRNHNQDHSITNEPFIEPLPFDQLSNNLPDNEFQSEFTPLTDKEFLTSSLAERTCQLDRGCQRKDRLNNTYLSYCARHKLEHLFSNDVIDDLMHGSSETCERVLDEFIRLDEQINKFDESFKTLLQRYNCHNGYSVKWTCADCKRAYKDWLCTTNLPYYMNGERVKPCLSFCERVEQRCPYLHPITKEQYGGQPAFICKDPNIPFVPEITPDTLHSKPGKCYDLCHLSNDKRELWVDSLSTYGSRCPSKSTIAEQVRDEDIYCQTNNNDTTTTDRDTTNNNNIGNKLIPCDQLQQQLQQQQQQQQINSLYLHPSSDESGNVHVTPIEHLGDNLSNNTNVINNHYPLHCEKLTELSMIFESYKSQPKGHSFSHHDH